MSTLLAGLALALGATPIVGISQGFVDGTRTDLFDLELAFYIAAALAVAIWIFVVLTAPGRRLVFVGGNRNAARRSGLRVARIRVGALITAALLSSVGGILLAGLFGSADATPGPQMLLPALAAVFLGGTAFTPGRFNVPGTFVAVYFLTFGVAGLGALRPLGLGKPGVLRGVADPCRGAFALRAASRKTELPQGVVGPMKRGTSSGGWSAARRALGGRPAKLLMSLGSGAQIQA